MTEGSDEFERQVSVDSTDGKTRIEVVDDDASDIVKNLLNALGSTVESASRIYVEIEESIEAEPETAYVTDVDPAPALEPEIDTKQAAAENPFAVASTDDEGVTSEGDDDTDSAPAETASVDTDGFDGQEINEGNAYHAVAWALRKHGPMRSMEVKQRVDDYADGTVTSTLSTGKEGHLFDRESMEGSGGGVSRWKLTDWGHEQISELGEYEVDDD